MEICAKIKALQMGKRNVFRYLLLFEMILLFLGIVGLFGKDAVYEYGLDDMNVNFGIYEDNHMGIYTDGQNGENGIMVTFEGLQLPRGTYRVQMQYFCDTDMKNMLEVTARDVGAENVRINPVSLFAGWDSTNEEMWLLRNTEQLDVSGTYAGEGSFAVKGLTIRQTNALNRICLFCMLCLFLAVNSIYLYTQYDKEYHITTESKTVTFLLGVTILFSCIPQMFNYVWGGADLGFHLMRVEGIADSISAGYFPNRISPEWQQGYGYAAPIFYGETLLYIAALFRLIGFSVVTSCRMFYFVITVATVLIAYKCFKKMFSNPYIGILCSAVYSLSVYRSYVSYMRTALGEGLAVMLLPIIAYGFYRVFSQDIHEESYKRSWLPLTIGFTLLVQTHLLTGELVGFFTIILCVVLWKKVIRPRTFIVLAKTVIYSILLSAWFLVPFLDYMVTGDFVIQHASGRTIQSRGGFPAHLLFTFFDSGSSIYFDQYGMADSSPVGVGLVLIVGLAIFGYLWITGKMKQLTQSEKALGVITASFGILAMVMSLLFFPWDKIHSLGAVAATLVSSIQFPSRLLTIANVCLTVVVGVTAKYMIKTQPREKIACFMAAMVFCLAIGSLYVLEDTADRQRGLRVYNEQGMGTGYISGAEYLPYGAKASLFMPHDPICTGEAEASDYEKEMLGARAYIENSSQTQEKIAFPLLYYKGYRAYSVESGEALNCYAGDNFEVTVDIPEGFEGMVKVKFVSPWYWRTAEIVTIVSVLIMAVFFIHKGRKIRKDDETEL